MHDNGLIVVAGPSLQDRESEEEEEKGRYISSRLLTGLINKLWEKQQISDVDWTTGIIFSPIVGYMTPWGLYHRRANKGGCWRLWIKPPCH